VVRIVDCVRWHEKAGVAKITAELSRKISSVRCQVGFVTREAANEGFPRRTRFLAPLSSCALPCFPGFTLGHRLIPERGRWSLARLYCVGTWMPNDESLLNVWFRRCSAVVDSSNVSKFA
jgi:hypothetical protein